METESFRIKGEVIQWNVFKRFGILLDSFNKKYIAFPDDIPADAIGRRYLKEGERVLFSPDPKECGDADPDSPSQTPIRARRVFFLSRPVYERFPTAYHELVTVMWSGERTFWIPVRRSN